MEHYEYFPLSEPAKEFQSQYLALPYPDKLTALAMLLEQMANGLINEENDVSIGNIFHADMAVLLPEQIGLDAEQAAHDILALLRDSGNQPQDGRNAYGGLTPDVAATHAEQTEAGAQVQGAFYRLDYGDKLLALAELFALVGAEYITAGDLALRVDSIPNGYDVAAALHRLYLDYTGAMPDDDGPF